MAEDDSGIIGKIDIDTKTVIFAAIVIAILVIGVLTNGLPFQTKEAAKSSNELMNQKIDTVTSLQQTTAGQLATLTGKVIDLATAQAKLQQQLDDERNQRQEQKQMKLETDLKAEKLARRLDQQHANRREKAEESAMERSFKKEIYHTDVPL